MFGAAATELGLEIPVYLYLIVMYSFLFSTYKLYLMLKEMFALSNQDEEEKEGDAEEGDLGASTGTTREAGDPEQNLLEKIGDSFVNNAAVDIFKKTFN